MVSFSYIYLTELNIFLLIFNIYLYIIYYEIFKKETLISKILIFTHR